MTYNAEKQLEAILATIEPSFFPIEFVAAGQIQEKNGDIVTISAEMLYDVVQNPEAFEKSHGFDINTLKFVLDIDAVKTEILGHFHDIMREIEYHVD